MYKLYFLQKYLYTWKIYRNFADELHKKPFVMKLLERKKYQSQIEYWLGKELIVVLTGQRRVGKSMCLQWLAQKVSADDKNNVIYIDKENYQYAELVDACTLNQYIEEHFIVNKHNYILIDEVQEIKEFEQVIRSWIKQPHTDIVITGSNAKMLSSDLSTKLAARYVEIPIHALSYEEFLLFHQLEDTDQALELYLTYGGLPYLSVLGLEDKHSIHEYLSNVYNTIVLKDIVRRESIRNVPFLMNLAKFVSDNVGKLISPNSIMKYMRAQGEKLSAQMILNYLTFLCAAFVVYRVYRFDIHGKSLLESNEKYYFEDLGIRNSLVNSTSTNDIEKRLENAVYLHLLRNGYVVRVGQLRSAEIDFVAQKEDKIVYLQVAYLIMNEETEKREFGNLLSIQDNYPKIVVSLNPMNTDSTFHGIRHMHLREFLKQEEL